MALPERSAQTAATITALLSDAIRIKADIEALLPKKPPASFWEAVGLSEEFDGTDKTPQPLTQFTNLVAQVLALPEAEAEFMMYSAWSAHIFSSDFKSFAEEKNRPNRHDLPKILDAIITGLAVLAQEAPADIAYRHFYLAARKLNNSVFRILGIMNRAARDNIGLMGRIRAGDADFDKRMAEILDSSIRDTLDARAYLAELYPHLDPRYINLMNHMLVHQPFDKSVSSAVKEKKRLAPFQKGLRTIQTLMDEIKAEDLEIIADAAKHIMIACSTWEFSGTHKISAATNDASTPSVN